MTFYVALALAITLFSLLICGDYKLVDNKKPPRGFVVSLFVGIGMLTISPLVYFIVYFITK